MEQLSPSDAVFLAMETPGAPGHVGGLTVLDPSGAPDFGYERLCAFVDARMRLEPRYTRRLREVPLGLDRPYLEDDPSFDVKNHLHRIAVPAPGGMRELAELVGYLFERPLDRRRPLWEMWLIEGVENGRMALFMKSHHCLMDGVSGAGLGELLCDLAPEPAERPLPPARQPDARADRPFASWEIGLRAAQHLAGTPLSMVRFLGGLARQTAAQLVAGVSDPAATPLPTSVPHLPFNTAVGPRRAFACATLPLEAVKQVKKQCDVTVNDVMLAVVGSALRRYLEARGWLPEQQLVAIIAMSQREAGDTSVGNAVSMVPVGWATDVRDPITRLRRIHHNAERSKQLSRSYDADILDGAGSALPPSVLNLWMRGFGPAFGPIAAPGNVLVSNVRATPVPLYVAGAKIESMYPMSILAPSQGLNVTVVSYMGRVDFGFTADPELVPDLWDLAGAIAPSLDELARPGASKRPRRVA